MKTCFFMVKRLEKIVPSDDGILIEKATGDQVIVTRAHSLSTRCQGSNEEVERDISNPENIPRFPEREIYNGYVTCNTTSNNGERETAYMIVKYSKV